MCVRVCVCLFLLPLVSVKHLFLPFSFSLQKICKSSRLGINRKDSRFLFLIVGLERNRNFLGAIMSRSTTPASLASSSTGMGHERTLGKDGRSLEFDRHIVGTDRRRSSVLSLITASSDNSGIKKKGPTPPGPPGPGGPNNLYQPKTLKFWLILVSNFLAMFLVALDRTIVATAIPQITDDFHSLGDIGWYAYYLPSPVEKNRQLTEK